MPEPYNPFRLVFQTFLTQKISPLATFGKRMYLCDDLITVMKETMVILKNATMKTIINFLLPFLALCPQSDKMSHSSAKRECIDLLSTRIFVDMPDPVRVQTENYEEGVILFYYFNDGGCIIFHEGALMQLDMDTYKPSKVVRKKKYSMYSGEHEGKMWKKCVYGSSGRVRIYYCNVKAECQEKYDKIFKTIKIKKLKT